MRLEDLRWLVVFPGLEFRPLVCEGEGWFSTEGKQDLGLVTWDMFEFHRYVCNNINHLREYPATPSFHYRPLRKAKGEQCSEGPSQPSCTSFAGEPQR